MGQPQEFSRLSHLNGVASHFGGASQFAAHHVELSQAGERGQTLFLVAGYQAQFSGPLQRGPQDFRSGTFVIQSSAEDELQPEFPLGESRRFRQIIDQFKSSGGVA